MTDIIPTYIDPAHESIFKLAPAGGGLVTVSKIAIVESEVSNRFDKQRKHDANYGKQKFLGVELAKFHVSFVVYPEDEYDFWANALPLLRPKGKAGASPALDVVNLQINRTGVRTVILVKAKIGPPSPRDGRHVSLELEEWSAGPTAPKKAATPLDDPDPLSLDPQNRPGMGINAFGDRDAEVAAGLQ